MKRREFILAFGGAAASIVRTQPLSAQQTRPVIGILGRTTAQEYAFLMAAVRKGLTEAGYVEGQNVTIEYRWADNHDDRLEAMASELVKKQVSVIFTSGGAPPALAARAATSTIRGHPPTSRKKVHRPRTLTSPSSRPVADSNYPARPCYAMTCRNC